MEPVATYCRDDDVAAGTDNLNDGAVPATHDRHPIDDDLMLAHDDDIHDDNNNHDQHYDGSGAAWLHESPVVAALVQHGCRCHSRRRRGVSGLNQPTPLSIPRSLEFVRPVLEIVNSE